MSPVTLFPTYATPHKAVSGKHLLQLLSTHRATLAFLLFHLKNQTILISQDQQIVLNRKCLIRISDIEQILQSG